MAVLVLVHGSTQSPRGWELLTPELEKHGHEVRTVDLPTDRPSAGGRVYAEHIMAALPEDSRNTVVVAHSASGVFLPLVAERRGVGGLVYLAAVIPKIGASVIEQVRSNEMLNPPWLGKNPMEDDIAREFLFHDCADAVVSWALTTRRILFAREAMMEPCPLTIWPQVPCSYILCTEDRTILPPWSRRAARERLGVEAIELPGGHCPHVSRPAHLAEVLSTLAST